MFLLRQSRKFLYHCSLFTVYVWCEQSFVSASSIVRLGCRSFSEKDVVASSAGLVQLWAN